MTLTEAGELDWKPKFHCWAASDVGRVRSNNEDCWAVSGQSSKQLSDRWEGPLEGQAWALVADGMGGHAAGKMASALATECLRLVLPSLSSEEEIRSAIEATNLALHDAMKRQPKLKGMGSTLAGVVALGGSATLFNAGDSRIYVVAGGTLERVSEDHVVRGNQLTKCLGGSSVPYPVDPYFCAFELARDTRILLCTDGLTDELDDDEIAALVTLSSPTPVAGCGS